MTNLYHSVNEVLLECTKSPWDINRVFDVLGSFTPIRLCDMTPPSADELVQAWFDVSEYTASHPIFLYHVSSIFENMQDHKYAYYLWVEKKWEKKIFPPSRNSLRIVAAAIKTRQTVMHRLQLIVKGGSHA